MTKDKGTLVPLLRFRGFTDAWVQRKLGEVAEFSKGNGYSKGDLIDKGNPIILYGRLYTNYETLIENVDTFTKMKENSVFSQGGEVIIPSSGETAEDISRASVVAKAGIILGGDLNIVKPDSTIYPTFLAIIISNGNQQKELSKRAQGKSVVHISNSDLKEVVLKLPSITEQTFIGNFIHTLDDTITLYKRKLDGLKELKKGYLQQMFPQVRKCVPRVRFAGFSGDWIESKLGEIVERVQGNDGRMDLPTLTISASRGWLDQRERFSGNIAGKEQENYTLLSRNELSYNKGNSKMAMCGVVYKLRSHDEALVPRVYHSFKPTDESDSNFLEYMFASKIPDTELTKLITSGARMDGLLNIGYESFMGIKIIIPLFLEQTVIGNFFRNFDKQIAAQQSKIEKLQILKSAYLQKMLI